MLVHSSQRNAAVAKQTAEGVKNRRSACVQLAKRRSTRHRGLIERGIAEGATPACGGTGRPTDFDRGYFARPTVLANVTSDMTIAREEIFGSMPP
jgi:acyl-CoA reductase-like NAD-dependent aldehyde dehydrogenase